MDDKIRTKCEFFLDKKTMVHILKYDNQFYNGLVLESNDKFIIIHDRMVGEVIIYYSEIKVIEPYKHKEVKR